ncbi:MAG TPA: hypothetical protein VNK41_05490 [Vicinamibacterales bacterium]|nr:hypothetical protein [Vicinamibacterales bacterium]
MPSEALIVPVAPVRLPRSPRALFDQYDIIRTHTLPERSFSATWRSGCRR